MRLADKFPHLIPFPGRPAGLNWDKKIRQETASEKNSNRRKFFSATSALLLPRSEIRDSTPSPVTAHSRFRSYGMGIATGLQDPRGLDALLECQDSQGGTLRGAIPHALDPEALSEMLAAVRIPPLRWCR
jgi:hypothetical protein